MEKPTENHFLIRGRDSHAMICDSYKRLLFMLLDADLHHPIIGRVFNGVSQETGADLLEDAAVDAKFGIFVEIPLRFVVVFRSF